MLFRLSMLVLTILLWPLPQADAQLVAPDGTVCSCTAGPFLQRWQAADKVYVAKAEEIRPRPDMRKAGHDDDPPIEVYLRVSKAYKNAAPHTTEELHTNLTKVTCTGHPFELGKTYLVYAYLRRAETHEYWSLYAFPTGTYDTGGRCGGTALIGSEQAQQDLRVLETMPPPVTAAPENAAKKE